MARRSNVTQRKRQRELRKAEKAANKRAKRHGLDEFDEGSDTESAEGSDTELVTESAEGSDIELVTESAEGSDTELVAESVGGSDTELVAESVGGSDTELVAESVGGTETELVAESVGGSDTELVEPVGESAGESGESDAELGGESDAKPGSESDRESDESVGRSEGLSQGSVEQVGADISSVALSDVPPEVASMAEVTTENVTAYCKVCKDVVEHVVVEKKGNSPKRVQCGSCSDVHPYRKSKPAPRKKAAKKDAASGDGSYESLVKGRDLSEATKYNMSAVFADADLIDHTTFGIGLVTRVLVDQKIEVLFPDSTKVLAHSR